MHSPRRRSTGELSRERRLAIRGHIRPFPHRPPFLALALASSSSSSSSDLAAASSTLAANASSLASERASARAPTARWTPLKVSSF